MLWEVLDVVVDPIFQYLVIGAVELKSDRSSMRAKILM
uniref:Uncharacterized protein n=1 Tax=Arundo donax TaxID=35708 RepID=A0A0A9CKA3_ARUDO